MLRSRTARVSQEVAAYTGIAIALVITLFPVYWIASNSFKYDIDIFAVPPEWFPVNPTLKHYHAAFIERPFLQYALNSLIIAVSTTAISVVLGTLAGYALARFHYPGRWRHQISFWILSTRMMPPIVTIIPLYLAFNYLNMLNTKPAVVIAYTAFNLPFELEEAAMVDGDTRWGAFMRVALPLARPGLAATAIFCLITSWNEFLLALILTLTERSQTLPIGIAGRVTQYHTYWGEISAAGFFSCIPIMIFAFIVQKHLVRGLSFGAVKG